MYHWPPLGKETLVGLVTTVLGAVVGSWSTVISVSGGPLPSRGGVQVTLTEAGPPKCAPSTGLKVGTRAGGATLSTLRASVATGAVWFVALSTARAWTGNATPFWSAGGVQARLQTPLFGLPPLRVRPATVQVTPPSTLTSTRSSLLPPVSAAVPWRVTVVETGLVAGGVMPMLGAVRSRWNVTLLPRSRVAPVLVMMADEAAALMVWSASTVGLGRLTVTLQAVNWAVGLARVAWTGGRASTVTLTRWSGPAPAKSA